MQLEFEIGVGLTVLGLLLALYQLVRRIGTTRVAARVIRVDVIDGPSGPANTGAKAAQLYKPTVRFQDSRGVTRIVTPSAPKPVERRVGDDLTVLYRVSDPQQAFIDDASVWVVPIVVASAGVALALMGLMG